MLNRFHVCVIAMALLAVFVGCKGMSLKEDTTNQIVFYVSVDGDDAWTGTLPDPARDESDGPFATLERARDAIRALKEDGKLNQPVTIYVRKGKYTLSAPFVLTPEDSGSAHTPITYAAYPGDEPVFSGGREILGWKKGPGDLWITHVPGVKEGAWYFRQLFVDGKRRVRARTPNDGFFLIDGPSSQDKPFQLKYRENEIKKEWVNSGEVEAIALLAWAELRMQIKSIDETNHIITLSGDPRPSNRENNARYYMENAPQFLDSPGEWYLDRTTGTLSYWPLPGEVMNHVEAAAPVLQQLVLFKGDPANGKTIHNISLCGLTFSHTDWTLAETGYADTQAAWDIPAAVSGDGVTACRIEQCRFIHLGNYALEFAKGCKHNQIIGNEMTDLGAGGIKIGEITARQPQQERTEHNLISDNHIHDIGIVYPAAIGVWIGKSSGNRIAHNHIHDTYYSGLSIGWTWGYQENTNTHHNIIEYNLVHDIGRRMLSDMGGSTHLAFSLEQRSGIMCSMIFPRMDMGVGASIPMRAARIS